MKKIVLLLLISFGINAQTKIKYSQMENPATSSVNLGTQTFSAGTSYLNKSRIGSSTAPSATLDVTGTMSVSGTSTLTGVQNNGQLSMTGRLVTTGSGSLQIASNTNQIGNLTLSSATTNTLTTGNTGTIAVLSDRGFVTPEDYGAVGDGTTNDATAIQNAVNSGLPVYFRDKNYRVNSAISIPDNTYIFGLSTSTISTTSNVAIFDITGSNITIENMFFQGNSTGTSQIGIRAVGNAGFTLYRVNIKVTNCTFTLLGGFGMYSQYMIGYNTGNEHQGSFYCTNCFFYNNYISIGLYERGEYNTFVNCVISKSTYGLVINAGNNSFIGGHIADCTANGVTIGTGVNDGHGIISGTKINHNGYCFSATGIVTNFLVDGCMIYAGNVYVATSSGIKFNNCEFSTNSFTLTNNTQLELNSCKFTTTATTYTVTGNKPIIRNCWSLSGDVAITPKTFVKNTFTLNANGTFTVPEGYYIEDVYFENTTANAVTGGVKIGTTNGGTEVVVAQAVGASEIVVVPQASLVKRIFSSSADQTLYIQAVTSWNSANLNMSVKLKPMY